MMRNSDNKFILIIIINVALFIAAYFQGGASFSYMNFGVEQSAILQYNQFYRIFTYSFFHASITHLGFNMLALYYLADPVIRFTNEKVALIIYFISAIGSGIAVLFLDNTVTIGASGAIYGLLGVLLYYGFKQRKYGYNELLNSLLPIIIINIIISFLPGISLLGHLSGLIIGLAATYIYDKYKYKRF